MEATRCKWSSSLGALECGASAESVWGTPDYSWPRDRNTPCVFFGAYSLRDFLWLKIHRGKKYVMWAGSDLRSLSEGFAFSDGKLRWLSRLTKGWFTRVIVSWLKEAEHYVENDWEASILKSLGIPVAGVCPSYMGQIDLPVRFKPVIPQGFCEVYSSASEGRQEEYGWGIIETIAEFLPKHRFHLYGAKWKTKHPNVIIHGRVPKEQMNEEIGGYHVGLRLNETDGFSEILAKAVLSGQYAIGRVKHPYIPSYENEYQLIRILKRLRKMREPNLQVREWYRRNLNAYPWNSLTEA